MSPAAIEDDPYGVCSQKNEMEFDRSDENDKVVRKEISV
jgi:hypothetical protein